MYPPLQSHGLMVKKWVPPKTRFISYTESDEPWAAYCGLGHYVDSLAPWYDVISEDGKSRLGWTKYDPTSIGITGRLAFAFTEKTPRTSYADYRLGKIVWPTISRIELQRRTWCRQNQYSKADCFEVWSCCPSNFPDLVEGGKAVKTVQELRKLIK